MNTKIWVGVENDKTCKHLSKTLFVEGIVSATEIDTYLNQVSHVCFGVNNSFNDQNVGLWGAMIKHVIDKKLWVTLEFDIKYVETILDYGFDEYPKFIAKIVANLPYISLFNYNAVLKITDQKKINIGNWIHSIHSLKDLLVFTHHYE
jgi:hypothetical protein